MNKKNDCVLIFDLGCEALVYWETQIECCGSEREKKLSASFICPPNVMSYLMDLNAVEYNEQ